MRIRARMSRVRGYWDTEQEALTAFVNERLIDLSYKQMDRAKKAEELELLEEGKKCLEENNGSSDRHIQDILNNLEGLKRATSYKRHKLIRTTAEEAREAYEGMKQTYDGNVRKAQKKLNELWAKEKNAEIQLRELLDKEAARWGEELEIPTLMKRTKILPEDMEHLRHSVYNFERHRKWCLYGPETEWPSRWLYRDWQRKIYCEGCIDDEEYKKYTPQNGSAEWEYGTGWMP